MEECIYDKLPDEDMMRTTTINSPWYGNLANYLAYGIYSDFPNSYQRRKFLYNEKKYFYDEPYLFEECTDNMICRCMLEFTMEAILEECHSSLVEGHHGGVRIISKSLKWLLLANTS